MAKKKRKAGGPRQVKGFRPGKEPAHLRKRQAKAQLGGDATWAQKQAVDLVADRTPDEVSRMMGRWITGLLVAAIVLAVLGVALYFRVVWAGIVVHVITAAVLFLCFRLRRQRDNLVEMAESLGRR